jgi:hypothetical protein
MTKAIRVSCLVYGRLLILSPRELRQKFGAEMVEVFEDLTREAVLQRGLAGMVPLWGSALWEVLSVAVPLRLCDTTVIAGALSLILSSALTLAFFRAVS